MTTDANYFDHDADIGIIGMGSTIEESFQDGAKAMFALMTNLSKIKAAITVNFEFIENDVELAFVTWLNTLLAKAQADNLIFSNFQIKKNENLWQAQAQGEKWNAEIERGIDVKGATLTMLSVKQKNDHWESKCIIDV